jgi:hypothetical protein
MEVKVLVCCHKEDVKETSLPYLPIQVGKAISKCDLGLCGDDSGDNISFKNGSYCELTGMYWAWKNLKGVDIIGLNHYRRYFDFYNQGSKGYPYTVISTADFSAIRRDIPDEVYKRVSDGYVVCPKSKYVLSVEMDYCGCHISDDFRTLKRVFKRTQSPKMKEAFFEVMSGCTLMNYNMFLMNWNDFDRYCTWLFELLEKVEAEIDITHYNSVQKRIFGYMAERLFNVWLHAEKRNRIIQVPVQWYVDDPEKYKQKPLLRETITNLRLALSNFFYRPRRMEPYFS